MERVNSRLEGARVGRESREREDLQVRAHPSSPELGLGLGRAGQGRVGLGLGCAIGNY